jgi:hypothetical protein
VFEFGSLLGVLSSQEEVQGRPDRRHRRQLADLDEGRGDSGPQDVTGQLELQAKSQVATEIQPQRHERVRTAVAAKRTKPIDAPVKMTTAPAISTSRTSTSTIARTVASPKKPSTGGHASAQVAKRSRTRSALK